MSYKIHFYKTGAGKQPAQEFIQGLTGEKRASLMAAIKEILVEQGINVCGTEFGTNLGKGLCEFRVRDKRGTLRVFFHAHGDKLILLLSGYDKGRRGDKRQAAAIKKARRFLADFKQNG